nr:hypothetical protein [Kribbella jiaozuonensis]
MGQGGGVAVGPQWAEVLAELYGGRGALGHAVDAGLEYGVHVEALEAVPAVGDVLVDLAVQPGLDERAEREEVAARDQVDGCPHQRTADGLAVLQELDEFGRLEVRQPGPQADVRRQRGLGLHAGQVFDRFQGGCVVAFEQPLAVERGTVQCLQAQLRHDGILS